MNIPNVYSSGWQEKDCGRKLARAAWIWKNINYTTLAPERTNRRKGFADSYARPGGLLIPRSSAPTNSLAGKLVFLGVYPVLGLFLSIHVLAFDLLSHDFSFFSWPVYDETKCQAWCLSLTYTIYYHSTSTHPPLPILDSPPISLMSSMIYYD